MFIIRNKAALAAGMVILCLFSSCGEADSLFSAARTYEVSAFTGSDSLDGSALVREGDKIQPYFIHSVRGDTDIYGLRVVVENLKGRQIGEALLYRAEAAGESGLSGAPDMDGDLLLDDFEDGVPGDTLAGDDSEEESANDEVPAGESLILEYGDDFAEKDRLVRVSRMDDEFPPFILPETLEPGAYILVFQVLGEGQRLISKTEKPFYYLAGMDYTLTEIKASLPGFSPTPYLVHPGTPMLLEAFINADEELDPYIVWYDGKTRIRAGRVKAGAGRFLWTVPNSLSFLHLRAEVTPFPPPDIFNRNSPAEAGRVKELSLPVSAKGRMEGTLSSLIETRKAEAPGRKFRYYRFEGNLLDSLDPVEELALLPLYPGERGEEENGFWISSGYSYGLAAGPLDAYRVPAFPLEAEEGEIEQYQIVLNFKPVSPGLIYTIFFTESRLELSWEEEGVVLNSFDGGGRQKQIAASLPDGDAFITVQLDFFVTETGVTAVLEDKEIILGLVSGDKGNIQLGGEAFSRTAGPNAPGLDSVIQKDSLVPVIILDELLLIRYPAVPLVADSASGENAHILAAL